MPARLPAARARHVSVASVSCPVVLLTLALQLFQGHAVGPGVRGVSLCLPSPSRPPSALTFVPVDPAWMEPLTVLPSVPGFTGTSILRIYFPSRCFSLPFPNRAERVILPPCTFTGGALSLTWAAPCASSFHAEAHGPLQMSRCVSSAGVRLVFCTRTCSRQNTISTEGLCCIDWLWGCGVRSGEEERGWVAGCLCWPVPPAMLFGHPGTRGPGGVGRSGGVGGSCMFQGSGRGGIESHQTR